METLKTGERIDYIIRGGPRIIQSHDVFSFSIDAVLLAQFASVPKTRGQMIDLCSGNGVVPIVLSTRSTVPIYGVEIQSRLVNMAERSVHLNGAENQVHIYEGDVKEATTRWQGGQFDLVTCNPPYFKTTGTEEHNKNPYVAAARHELFCTLDDVIRVSSGLAKHKGKVAFVHRPERLPELITAFRRYQIEPKRLKMVHSTRDMEANIVLLEGIKGGKPGMNSLPPLFVYEKDKKTYSEEFLTYYEGR